MHSHFACIVVRAREMPRQIIDFSWTRCYGVRAYMCDCGNGRTVFRAQNLVQWASVIAYFYVCLLADSETGY